jgi:hypothetical protein
MHALLEWEGHPSQPPAALLGLTDKPPGSLAPGERWWPSVGCGPVEHWWALWWTRPDEQARRGGMVRSDVLLWRLDEVRAVDSLLPALETLSGQRPIPLPASELLGAVAEALLEPNPGPPVLADLDAWPGLIAALWSRLWPEARRAFSARVAISPPQGGESVTPPWIFGMPSQRALQWRGHRLITVPSELHLSRAARWLMGEKDPTFDEVRTACPPLPADLGSLVRVARAADRLDRLREAHEPQQALNFLRTMLILTAGSEAAAALKKEGLSILVRGLTGAPHTFVRSLANLALAQLPERQTLENAVKDWISREAPELSTEEALQILELLSPGRAENWWQQAVHTSLASGLANLDARWASAALHWAALPHAAESLRTLLPPTERVEKRLLAVTSGAELSETELRQLRQQTVERRWPSLHAWAAMQTSSPHEALQSQLNFPGDSSAGLTLLVERLPGEEVVQEAISSASAKLLELVALRTAREPELLGPLDADHPRWRALWAAHVRAGGANWPPGVNRESLGRSLLDAVLAGDEPEGLIASLAESLADIALDHPERSSLWARLSSPGRAALLPRVAEALVRRCDAGLAVPNVERPLAEAVLSWARRARPSARVFAALLSWDVPLGEEEVIQWMARFARADWALVTDSVGRAVLSRKWFRVARMLYDHYRSVPELRPAVESCQELLPTWERLKLSWNRQLGSSTGSVHTLLVNRVAELGADLAPEQLEYLWEHAGGERKRLRTYGTPEARWQEAATLARNGSLPGGLTALVQELRDRFPHNPDLQELSEMLASQR